MQEIICEIKTLLRIVVKYLIPYKFFNILRKFRQKAKRQAERQSVDYFWSVSELQQHLRNAPIDPSRDIFIHAAFSKINTQSKAEDVINILLSRMDKNATILMPAYPMPGGMLAWMSDPAIFDVRNTPSTMGILSEIFRKRPEAHRSKHPTHSVAAIGPKAEFYTKDHHLCQKPCAEGSPFAKLLESDGQILCIGTNIGKMTAYHVIEDTDPDFPIQTYLPETMQKLVKDGELKFYVETKVGNPRLSPWRIDNYQPKLKEFRQHLQNYKCLKIGNLGSANLDVIDGSNFLFMLKDLAKKGVTIYHRPRMSLIRILSQFPY